MRLPSAALAVLATLLLHARGPAATKSPPSVLLMLADDLGHSDVGFNGNVRELYCTAGGPGP